MNANLTRFLILIFLLFTLAQKGLHAQEIQLDWKPRKDLNILLPQSVRMYEANGFLPDSSRIRAFYASIDLSDENLELRAVGSNEIRRTTEEAYHKNNGILAINGGYFSNNASVSLLISDGEVISPGPTEKVTKGAFALVAGTPKIIWSKARDSSSQPLKFINPIPSNLSGKPIQANQAVGGGPVLLKNGKINITSEEEGFGGSHLLRHPRTAIGYSNPDHLIMMVVDGRQNASAGVTLPELAQLMKQVGAVEAVNLDGGGSSAMVASGEVVNIPADITGGNRNSLRHNASAIVLSQISTSEEKETYIFDTNSQYYTENGIWRNSNHVNFYGETPSRIASANQSHNKAIYSFDSIPRKEYQLAAWWTVNPEKNAEKIAYVIHHGGETENIYKNHAKLSASGKWNILGKYILGPGDRIEIMGTGQKGKMLTDAIRLISTKNSPKLPVRGDLRVAVISDLNSGLGEATYEWQVDSIVQRIPRIWKPDLVLTGGDMVAGMGISDTLQLQKMWAGFDKHIAEPLKKANIPFAFTIGNHDGPRSYPIERNATVEYWKNPKNSTGLNFVDKSHFPHYYSFLEGEVFFVSWDASSPEITEENLAWLEKQFQLPEAKNAELRFVMGHMPLYSVAQERDSKGNVLANPEKLRQLLQKYHVHTYISGHQHAYYPGKRGKLHLLNTGAAGSGPRRWLTQERKPVNTITLMDIFHDRDTIVYTTYKIKEKKAENMEVFDEKSLPSAMFGVNGHIVRRDIEIADKATGEFSPLHVLGKSAETGKDSATAEFDDDDLLISGHFFNMKGELIKDDPIGIYKGRNTEEGELLKILKSNSQTSGVGTFSGQIKKSQSLKELLSVGALYISIKTEEGELRTQLYPQANEAPPSPKISSHNGRNIYAVRNIQALYEIAWENKRDKDGDFVSYIYQLASDKHFQDIVFQQKTGRIPALKMTEKEWFQLLGNSNIGEEVSFYHRVLASDGKNISYSKTLPFNLMKSTEPLDDFIEVPAPEYEFMGKIENASGGGYGAEWDKEGKLWLASYRGKLTVKEKDGSDAPFSPITSVEINGKEYNLNPITGIGVGLDGNILIGKNRHLIKIDAATGKGIAVWEVPEGERAITSPQVNEKGEIYAMSLFADDPNYVLKQSTENPGTFELLRTIELENRILSRDFDMSPNGKNLYFPDPGSPLIQKYISTDGITYTKEENINSTASGSSAIKIIGQNSIYAAVRAGGVSPSSFHYRNEAEQKMWTLELPEVNGAEPRGIGVSPNQKTLIFAAWDKGGGFYRYELKE